MTITEFAQEAINRLCPRCHYGDVAIREQWHDGGFHWVHGVDYRGDIYINPEPCNAHEIHELLIESQPNTPTLLPCGCYSDACYCGQYPTRKELDAMEAAPLLEPVKRDDRYPTLAERLAESMKDDKRP